MVFVNVIVHVMVIDLPTAAHLRILGDLRDGALLLLIGIELITELFYEVLEAVEFRFISGAYFAVPCHHFFILTHCA